MELWRCNRCLTVYGREGDSGRILGWRCHCDGYIHFWRTL